MESLGKTMFDSLAAKSLSNYEEGDYTDSEGFLVCGKCHTRKEFEITLPEGFGQERIKRVGVACKCKQEEMAKEKAAREREEFNRRMIMLQKDGITDLSYLRYTFANDDERNKKATEICKKYVDTWEEMKKNNYGILFYGGVGTGKSFLACCIANALIEKLVPVSVTNFPRILNRLQGFGEERQKFIDRLQQYSLLVIDDLGVERDTSYSVEQVYNVIDTRYRSGKPLIVTTNLSMNDLENPPSIAYKRIYDRVLEMCPIPVGLVGESRRAGNATDRRNKAKKLLGV